MNDQLTLQNGIRLVLEHLPDARSASIGIWVGVGSRNETARQAGFTHFIEHMLFKGTSSRSASELAAQMDSLGGQFNAYTDRETTCYHARVISERLDEATDLLADMFFHSLFREEDIISERSVILEEMDMYRDAPDDLVVEQLFRKAFPGALGREVLGARRVLLSVTRDDLISFMEKEFIPDRTVVSLCGNYSDNNVAHITELFSQPAKLPLPSCPRQSAYRSEFIVHKKPIEQNHICLSWPGLSSGDPDRFAWHVLCTILGGGMSSRLFQTIREKNGLCYSISSFTASFRETGAIFVATATNRDADLRAIRMILEEAKVLTESKVSSKEKDLAIDQIRSEIILSHESTSARMSRLGSSVLTLGHSMSLEELLQGYFSVQREDILRLAQKYLSPDMVGFSAVGRLSPPEKYLLAIHS